MPDLLPAPGIELPVAAAAVLLVGLPAGDWLLFGYERTYRRLFHPPRDPSALAGAYSIMAAKVWADLAVAVGIVALFAASPLTLDSIGLTLPAPWLTAVSLLAAAALAVGYSVRVVRSDPVPADSVPDEQVAHIPKDRTERLLYGFTAGLSAGFCEEIVYRGIAIAALVGLGLTVPVAVLLASISFALRHGTIFLHHPGLFPIYVGTGVVLSVGYLLAGSLLPVMVAHAVFNLGQTIATFSGDGAPGLDEAESEAKTEPGSSA